MGTHAALGVTWKDGRHECIEWTLDGYNLLRLRDSILKAAITENEEALACFIHQETDRYLVEYCDEREHEQEYFVYVNFKWRVVLLSQSMIDSLATVVNWYNEFTAKGWILNVGYECPEHVEKENQ